MEADEYAGEESDENTDTLLVEKTLHQYPGEKIMTTKVNWMNFPRQHG